MTLVDTGEEAMTGAPREARRAPPGRSDLFLCTYGDGVADVDVAELVALPPLARRAWRP